MSKPLNQFLSLSSGQWSVSHFLSHSVSLTYKACNNETFPACYMPCQTFSSQILYPWQHLVNTTFDLAVQCIINPNNTILSTLITQCTYLPQCLLFLNYTTYACTLIAGQWSFKYPLVPVGRLHQDSREFLLNVNASVFSLPLVTFPKI